VQEHGIVESKVREGKKPRRKSTPTTFDYSETLGTIPSHRALALFRGRREDMLDVRLRLDSEEERPAWSAPHNPVRRASPAASASRTRTAPPTAG